MNLQQNANYQLMPYIMRWQKKREKSVYQGYIYSRLYNTKINLETSNLKLISHLNHNSISQSRKNKFKYEQPYTLDEKVEFEH